MRAAWPWGTCSTRSNRPPIRFGPGADEHGILQVWTTASAQVGGSFRKGITADCFTTARRARVPSPAAGRRDIASAVGVAGPSEEARAYKLTVERANRGAREGEQRPGRAVLRSEQRAVTLPRRAAQ